MAGLSGFFTSHAPITQAEKRKSYFPANSNRLLISSQFTVFHQAAR
jgi:hypothetical protein